MPTRELRERAAHCTGQEHLLIEQEMPASMLDPDANAIVLAGTNELKL